MTRKQQPSLLSSAVGICFSVLVERAAAAAAAAGVSLREEEDDDDDEESEMMTVAHVQQDSRGAITYLFSISFLASRYTWVQEGRLTHVLLEIK